MANQPSSAFTDLDRRFYEIPARDTDLDPEDMMRSGFALHRSQTWEQILAHRYLVVLGEAGTGKTTEFRHRATALASSGRSAFFVEVRCLATDGLCPSLPPDDVALLNAWKQSKEQATFFLDSVDEAKLQRRTLGDALRKLRHDLKDEWSRVRLAISCRASDWQATGDREYVAELIPKDSKERVHVVQIAPLNAAQVRKLAAANGTAEIDAFAAAIKANNAEAFGERPLDVRWLGAYWQQHRQIASLRELIEANVQEKLKEPGARRATLSLARAAAGVRALASIACLKRQRSFLLPPESQITGGHDSAIDPTEFLVHWSPDEVTELLGRPIFDESTYGRVRFHHRSVQEYLAARWLHDLYEAGMPYVRLRELILRQEGAESVVPEHLAQVAAWLSLWVEPLRIDMIREAPALLMAYGDPSGLSAADRAAVLKSYAQSYAGRERRFDDFDLASLARFSAPALSGTIRSLLSDSEQPDELKVVLLELVERGRLTKCVPLALRRALDHEVSSRVRLAAIRAVAIAGSSRQRRQLLSLVESEPAWEHDVAGAFVGSLYPDMLQETGLLKVLQRTKPGRDNFLTILKSVLEGDVPRRGDASMRLRLLERLLDFVSPRGAGGVRATAPGRHWLERSLGNLFAAVLDDLPKSEGTAQLAVVRDALDWFRQCNEHGPDVRSGLDAVRDAVNRHEQVRRDIFWHRVQEHREKTGKVPVRVHDLRYRHDLFEFTAGDLGWLARDASTRIDLRERLLAFDALRWIPQLADQRDRFLDLLRNVAATHPALRTRLERQLTHVQEVDPAWAKFARKQRAREVRRARRDEDDRKILLQEIEGIRAGRNFNGLLFLLRRAREKDSSNRYGTASVEPLRELYGDEVAHAAVDGWRAFWRTCDPGLPHERKERNRVSWSVVVGLAGATADFEKGLDAESLDDRLAVKACRLAANELNGFPEWLTRLAIATPKLVARTLKPTLAADYLSPVVVHDVLAKLPTSDEPVRAACASIVARLVAEGDAPTIDALEDALAVLLSAAGAPHNRLVKSIAGRCREAQADQRRFALWWYAWACIQADAALDFLEALLEKAPAATAYGFVESICDRIHDGLREVEFTMRHDAVALARLIPLVYSHITVEEDIWHEGVFHPGARDHAQEVRGSLVAWLASIPGDESVASLRRIAEDPRCDGVRDWLLRKADERILGNAGQKEPDIAEALVNLCRKYGTRAREHVKEDMQAGSGVRILFLGFCPTNQERLSLDEEVRSIRLAIRAAELRDAITLSERWAVRLGDLQQALLDERPTVVHFSGHGGGADGLVLHGDVEGQAEMLTTEALTRLMRDFRETVRVVVLNSCHSEVQAKALQRTVDFAVGMNRSVLDRAAQDFATAFYRALGYGHSVQDAFNQGVTAIAVDGMPREVRNPVLFVRAGLDPKVEILTSKQNSKTKATRRTK